MADQLGVLKERVTLHSRMGKSTTRKMLPTSLRWEQSTPERSPDVDAILHCSLQICRSVRTSWSRTVSSAKKCATLFVCSCHQVSTQALNWLMLVLGPPMLPQPTSRDPTIAASWCSVSPYLFFQQVCWATPPCCTEVDDAPMPSAVVDEVAGLRL